MPSTDVSGRGVESRIGMHNVTFASVRKMSDECSKNSLKLLSSNVKS
jgi:hypothetical protein